MRKLWFITLLLAVVALPACAPAATPAVTATATALPEPSATAPAAGQATAVFLAGDTMQCSLESTVPTPNPTEMARFAPVTDQDWAQGPAGASVTILEYSDFM